MTQAEAVARLKEAGVPDPARDVRRLFDWAYAVGAEAGPQDRDTPNARTQALFAQAIADRARRRPVSQITGRRAFWRHDFAVTGDVLDPRPDTETLVELALSEPFARLLDLGTGSGAIAISLLADTPGAHGTATDISDAALAVARENAARIGVADRLVLIRSDWFEAVEGTFDLIVSNPPYIAGDEMAALDPEVRDWEPRIALTPGGDGLDAYRAILSDASAHLEPGGRLLVEIGPEQGAAVSGLFQAAGLEAVEVRPDINGRDRVVSGRKG